MSAIVGVVPNFSEGRRRDVIDAIVGALGVEGARVVFAEADPDHHRLDTTVLGTADAVRRSADRRGRRRGGADRHVRAPRRASSDGRGGRGPVHAGPRRRAWTRAWTWRAPSVGSWRRRSTCPSTSTARRRVAPERRSLADVRKGEFEGLREAVAAGERLPDFGPHEIGRAGATAVGARKPLVAFNTYLSGTDEAAAKDIARGDPRIARAGSPPSERSGSPSRSEDA